MYIFKWIEIKLAKERWSFDDFGQDLSRSCPECPGHLEGYPYLNDTFLTRCFQMWTQRMSEDLSSSKYYVNLRNIAVEGFLWLTDGQTNEQTFVNVVSLSWLKFSTLFHIRSQLGLLPLPAARSKCTWPLWHKVDIRNFHCHKNVNFCNNFVGLMIPDDLKSKILTVYRNIFSLHPPIDPIDPRNSDLMFFKFRIRIVGNITKNVVLGANNTPN